MNSNGNITEPVNSIDPYQATGTPAWSDGSYPIAINAFQELVVRTRMWSRFKPVPGGDADENIKNSEWWKGPDGYCGLTPLRTNNQAEIVNYCNGSANGWKYDLAGLIWARILDWSGYKHTPRSTEGIGTVRLQGTSMTVGDAGVALIFSKTSGETYDLGYEDFSFLQACRFGAYLKRDGSAGGMRVIASDTVLKGFDNLTLSGQSQGRPQPDTITGDEQTGTSQPLTSGTWRIYPFLFADGTHYSIPYANMLTLTVNEKSDEITIKAEIYSATALKAEWRVTITNNTSVAITLDNNSIYFRKPGASAGDGVTVEEYTEALTIGRLAGGASVTLSGSSKEVAQLIMNYGWCDIYVTLGQGQYTKWEREQK